MEKVSFFRNDVHYNKSNVDLSIDTKKRVNKFKKLADNPKNFDPTFIFEFGSKNTLVPNFNVLLIIFF